MTLPPNGARYRHKQDGQIYVCRHERGSFSFTMWKRDESGTFSARHHYDATDPIETFVSRFEPVLESA